MHNFFKPPRAGFSKIWDKIKRSVDVSVYASIPVVPKIFKPLEENKISAYITLLVQPKSNIASFASIYNILWKLIFCIDYYFVPSCHVFLLMLWYDNAALHDCK